MNNANINKLIEFFGILILVVLVISGAFLFSRVALAQEGETVYAVEVLVIGGEYFPFSQFHVAKEQLCPAQHYHPMYGAVYSMNNLERFDPNPIECGFGVISEVTRTTILISQGQVDSFQGFNLDMDISMATKDQVMELSPKAEEDVVGARTGIAEFISEREGAIKATLVIAAPLIIASSVPLWGYIPYAPRLIIHFFAWLVALFRKKKKARVFGVAYDSIVKQPLRLAIIRVFKDKKLVATKVSDRFGRYDLLLEPGLYHLELRKPGFTFPSTIVTAKVDGDFEHVYSADEKLRISESESITPDAPMDPENYIKKWEVGSVVKKIWLGFQKIGHYASLPLLVLGTLLSLVVVFVLPADPLNWLIFIVYLLFMLMQFAVRQPRERGWGIVYNATNNTSLPLAVVQLIDSKFNKIVASRLSDYAGRYSFLPEPGEYVIKVDKQGYKQIVETQNFASVKGINPLKGKIKIKKSGQHIKGDILMKKS